MSVTHAHKGKEEILVNPTRPFDPVGATTISEILVRMQGAGFQGRQLGLAFDVWKKILGRVDHHDGAPVANGIRPRFTMGQQLKIET